MSYGKAITSPESETSISPKEMKAKIVNGIDPDPKMRYFPGWAYTMKLTMTFFLLFPKKKEEKLFEF